MFGLNKKEKQRPPRKVENPKKTTGLAALMGMDPTADLGGDDDDFEAQLAAIMGGTTKSKPKAATKEKKMLTTEELDKIQKKLGAGDLDDLDDLDLGGGADGSGGSDISDSELLQELDEINLDENVDQSGDESDDDTKINDLEIDTLTPISSNKPLATPTTTATTTARASNRVETTQNSQVAEIRARLNNYQEALQNAKNEGAESKIRRLERGIKTIETMLKEANKGQKVNLDDLPTPVAVKLSTNPANKEPDTIKEEPAKSSTNAEDELAMWAAEMTDESIAPPTKHSVRAAPPPPSIPTDPTISDDVTTIKQRLELYQNGLRLAEENNEISKIRRYKREVEILHSLVKSANNREKINWDEVPPEISLTQPKPQLKQAEIIAPLISFDDNISSSSTAGALNKPPTTPYNTNSTIVPQVQQKQLPPIAKKPLGPPITLSAETTTTEHVKEFLTERMGHYKQAAAMAINANDTPKARSLYAKVKGFNNVIEALEAGKPITLENLPPAPPGYRSTFLLSVNSWPLQNTPTETTSSKSQIKEEVAPVSIGENEDSAPPAVDPDIPIPSTLLEGLQQRLDKYKDGYQKALDTPNKARRMGRIVKQYEEAIAAHKKGQPVDIQELPVPPGYPPLPPPGARPRVVHDQRQAAPAIQTLVGNKTISSKPVQQEIIESPAANQDEELPEYDTSIPVPKTIMEGLISRIVIYKESLENAKKEGQESKIRRMNRIVKQYEEAITANKRGAKYDYEELPAPPGYPPLPLTNNQPIIQKSITPSTAAAPTSIGNITKPILSSPIGTAPAQTVTLRPPNCKLDQATYDKQIQILSTRIKELVDAAKEAKLKNDIDTAKKYLISKRGVEQMLEMAKNGLRVDFTQVPPSPKSIINNIPTKRMTDLKKATDKDEELFQQLEKSFREQIEICSLNQEQCSSIGEIGKSTQFQNFGEQSKKDLLTLLSAKDNGYVPPAYHYENRQIPIFHVNPSIEQDQCQIEVVRCINIPLPKEYESKDLDIYVSLEFPFPTHEEPQTLYTKSIRGSASPEFNDPKIFKIDRGKIKSFMRTCKRHPLKIIILLKKGMLRKDDTLGTASLTLNALSNKAQIHETVAMFDGRKQTSSKIEVRVRLREPLEVKDCEMQNKQWLILDEFIDTGKKPMIAPPKNLKQKIPASTPTTTQGASNTATTPSASFISPAKIETTCSVEVLKYEQQICLNNMSAFKKLNKPVPQVLLDKDKAISDKIKSISLNMSIPSYKKKYLIDITQAIPRETEMEAFYLKENKPQYNQHHAKRKQIMLAELKAK